MTLAEIFFLMLIVGAYGSRLESEPSPSDGPNLTPAELRERLKDAEEELNRERQSNRALGDELNIYKELLDWWGRELGAPEPIRDKVSIEEALRIFMAGVAEEARRGKPSCADNNILIEVERDQGRVSLTIQEPFPPDEGTYLPSQTLVGSDIEMFLSVLSRHYRAREQECVFDFRLLWRTDRDYRLGKQEFDPYFYPAGDRQLQ